VKKPSARRPGSALRPAAVERSREKFYLTYPRELVKEPILYQLGQKFRVVTNIRGANISDEIGLVALELDGAGTEIEAAVRWLREVGVQVEPIAKNVIE
jgi:L-aspartate semialdehyde sulfurtransferase ferredoxin